MAGRRAGAQLTLEVAEISVWGAFFKADPKLTVGHNIELMLEQLAVDTEQFVKDAILQHRGEMPFWTGWTHEHVVGRVRSYSGKRWYRTAVVSVSTQGLARRPAIRTKAAGASIERRWRPFKAGANLIRRQLRRVERGIVQGLT